MGKINQAVKEETGAGCFWIMWTFVTSYALLITAIVMAFQANWPAAIFLAILWMGWTNNSGSSLRYATDAARWKKAQENEKQYMRYVS